MLLIAGCSNGVNTKSVEPLVYQGWEKAKISNICLSDSIKYEEVDVPKFEQPVREDLIYILELLNIRVSEEENCDASMAIDLALTPIAGYYDGLYRCYTGSSSSGTLQLTKEGFEPVSISLDRISDPPEEIPLGGCVNIDLAPYRASWEVAMLIALRELWGNSVLELAAASNHSNISGNSIRTTMSLFETNDLTEDEVLMVLSSAMQNENWRVKGHAIDALEFIGTSSVVPILMEGLVHEGNATQSDAIHALGELGPMAAEAVPALLEIVLDEEQYMVHPDAIRLLGKIGPAARSALPDLLEILSDPYADLPVREAIVIVLPQLRPELGDAIPPLIAFLQQANEKNWKWTTGMISGTLISLTDEDFGTDAQAWQDWWDSQ